MDNWCFLGAIDCVELLDPRLYSGVTYGPMPAVRVVGAHHAQPERERHVGRQQRPARSSGGGSRWWRCRPSSSRASLIGLTAEGAHRLKHLRLRPGVPDHGEQADRDRVRAVRRPASAGTSGTARPRSSSPPSTPRPWPTCARASRLARITMHLTAGGGGDPGERAEPGRRRLRADGKRGGLPATSASALTPERSARTRVPTAPSGGFGQQADSMDDRQPGAAHLAARRRARSRCPTSASASAGAASVFYPALVQKMQARSSG